MGFREKRLRAVHHAALQVGVIRERSPGGEVTCFKAIGEEEGFRLCGSQGQGFGIVLRAVEGSQGPAPHPTAPEARPM